MANNYKKTGENKKRTYYIELESGGIMFKYFTPMEMNELLDNRAQNPKNRANKWKKIVLVGRSV